MSNILKKCGSLLLYSSGMIGSMASTSFSRSSGLKLVEATKTAALSLFSKGRGATISGALSSLKTSVIYANAAGIASCIPYLSSYASSLGSTLSCLQSTPSGTELLASQCLTHLEQAALVGTEAGMSLGFLTRNAVGSMVLSSISNPTLSHLAQLGLLGINFLFATPFDPLFDLVGRVYTLGGGALLLGAKGASHLSHQNFFRGGLYLLLAAAFLFSLDDFLSIP